MGACGLPVHFINKKQSVGTMPPKTPKQRLNVKEKIVERVCGLNILTNKPGVVAEFKVDNKPKTIKQNKAVEGPCMSK